MPYAFSEFTDDRQALAGVIQALGPGSDLAKLAGGWRLDWWTEPNRSLEVLGADYPLWYPEHYAVLSVPSEDYEFAVDEEERVRDAVATALGTDPVYEPLMEMSIAVIYPEPEPPVKQVETVTRGDYQLTHIEAKFYDELCETDLVFSVQTTLHSSSIERRPDFVVYVPNGRPVVVEVDGHEYHHTREQRTGDAIRERWLTARGFDFVRFTGSEIWADTRRCVRELQDWVRARNR